MGLELFRQILEKSSNVNFHKNPSSGSRVVSCGWTDVTEEVVPFHGLRNTPKDRKCTYTLGALSGLHIVGPSQMATLI